MQKLLKIPHLRQRKSVRAACEKIPRPTLPLPNIKSHNHGSQFKNNHELQHHRARRPRIPRPGDIYAQRTRTRSAQTRRRRRPLLTS